jgi:hypothetical protein
MFTNDHWDMAINSRERKNHTKKSRLKDAPAKISSVMLLLSFVVVIVGIATSAATTTTTAITPIPSAAASPVTAAAAAPQNNTLKVELVVDTTTLKFPGASSNSKPVPGEFAIVSGKLYNASSSGVVAVAAEEEIGTYRCFFPWGGWANDTQGTPVTLGVQIFDLEGRGTIVVVGDEPTTDSVGKPVAGAIAGGTGEFKGATGMATLTAKPLKGTDFPLGVVFEFA